MVLLELTSDRKKWFENDNDKENGLKLIENIEWQHIVANCEHEQTLSGRNNCRVKYLRLLKTKYPDLVTRYPYLLVESN